MESVRPDHRTGPYERARWSVLFPVLLAFVAVIASFVGSSLYADRQAAGIQAQALAIADDAAPGIALLSAARSELHQFRALMTDYTTDAVRARPIDRAGLDRVHAELDRDLRRYQALPFDPAERDALRVVTADLAALDDVTARVMNLIGVGEAERARELADHAFRDAIDRASDAMVVATDLDAREAQALAVSIEQSRGRSHRIAMGLDALSVALAVLALSVAMSFVVRYLSLSRDHALYVERRADELEQFAGRVAHDVLGPLTSVALALDLTSRRVGEDRAALTTLERGQRGIARARTVVDGLLSFAKAGAAPEPGARADVAGVLRDVMDEIGPVAREAGVELAVGAAPEVAARCSPGVLTSIVCNLVRNAIKYIGAGPVRRVEIRVTSARALVRVEVTDTGPGIPGELRDAIFEPYVRAAGGGQPGLGLGLATVKRLVGAHGGRVGLRSTVGAGSTFWFELPVAAAEPPSGTRPDPSR